MQILHTCIGGRIALTFSVLDIFDLCFEFVIGLYLTVIHIELILKRINEKHKTEDTRTKNLRLCSIPQFSIYTFILSLSAK